MVASDLETAKKRSVVPPPRRLSADSEQVPAGVRGKREKGEISNFLEEQEP